MKYLAYLVFIILLFGLNIGFFSLFKLQGVAPNLLLIMVMLFALEKGGLDFFFIAVLSGFFLDFFSGAFFGGYSLGFLLLAFLLNLVVRNFAVFEMNWKFLTGTLLASVLFVDLFIWLYDLLIVKSGLTNTAFINFSLFKRQFLIQFFYNLLLLFPMLRLKDFLQELIQKFTYRF
jgi:rod shape-determining protein MreD